MYVNFVLILIHILGSVAYLINKKILEKDDNLIKCLLRWDRVRIIYQRY